MRSRRDAAFDIPDLEEVFSLEEILAFWGEVGEGASSGAGPSGAGPSPP